MSQATQTIGEVLKGDRCALCGRQGRRLVPFRRPSFVLTGRTSAQLDQFTVWFAKTPPCAAFCVDHLPRMPRWAAHAGSSRIALHQVQTQLWFSAFGHPLEAKRALWRPAKRTPLEGGGLTIGEVLAAYEREQATTSEGADAGAAGVAAAAQVGQGGPADGADRGRQEGGSGWLFRSLAVAGGLFLRIAGR